MKMLHPLANRVRIQATIFTLILIAYLLPSQIVLFGYEITLNQLSIIDIILACCIAIYTMSTYVMMMNDI